MTTATLQSKGCGKARRGSEREMGEMGEMGEREMGERQGKETGVMAYAG